MPFKSEAQRSWMYANEPETAKKWEKHTPKRSFLPEYVKEKKANILDRLRNAIAKKKEDEPSDDLLRDTVIGGAGLAAGGTGMYLADRWKPNNTIVVGAGHIKDHGVPKDSLLRKSKSFWRKTPMNRMYIADTGAGHIAPGEAIVEALLEHPDVGFTKDKKWLLDTAFRGGRYGSHKNPYASANRAEKAFGTIDTGFGPLSTSLPGPLALNNPEFKTNPFGRLMVETDPVAGIPNISAVHGVHGMTHPTTWKDTPIATFGSERAKEYKKIDPDIDVYGQKKPTWLTRKIKEMLGTTWGKYKPVIHASDTISPYMSNASYESAQNIIDAVRTGAISEHDVLRQLAKQNPEYANLIEDAIAKNKRIAFITGSSRGDVVAQKTQDLLDHLKKNNINDVQIISAMGERLTPTVAQLASGNALPNELKDVLQKELAANPNITLEEVKKMLPKGGQHYKTIDRLLDIPRTDKLITDPNVIKLPGVHSTIKAGNKDVKTFLALQAMFPHWASTGMNSANEIMMLPGTQAMPLNIGEMKLKEIDNALKQKIITKDQAEEMRKIFLERWNAGTVDLYRERLSKSSPGIYGTNSAEDFAKAMDAHYKRTPMERNQSITRAQEMLNESKSSRKRFADQYLAWLEKQHSKARKFSRGARLAGAGALGVGGIFAIKALLEARNRLKENTPGKRRLAAQQAITKESMLKTANRFSKVLAELEAENTPEAKAKMERIKERLKKGLPKSTDKIDPITFRAIKKLLKDKKNPKTLDAIKHSPQTEHMLVRRGLEAERAKGVSKDQALKNLESVPERAGWRAATRLVENEPGPKDSKFSRRGFEGDALWGFNPEEGDVVIKKTHLHPKTTKYRKSGPIPVKPSLTKETIAPFAGQLDPKAMSSGAPIQEKIKLMQKYPDIMARIIAPTQTGYVMPRLKSIEEMEEKELAPLMKNFIDRLWKRMHPYDRFFTSKKEIEHQIHEGNPKEKWNGRYRKIFGNRTPITLRDGTAIEDYHKGNLMIDDKGKIVISDPQLSHRGSRWNRQLATAGVAGLGIGGLSLAAAALRKIKNREKIDPDKTDVGLGALGAGSLIGARIARNRGWAHHGKTPMRTGAMAPLLGLGGLSIGALGLKSLMGGKKDKQELQPAT